MPAAGPALQENPSASGPRSASHSGEGTKRVAGKASSGSLQPSFHTKVFLDILHGSKERQQVATDSQSTTIEQVHHPQEIQDGNSVRDPQVAVCWPVGHFARPQGRILAHPGTSQRPRLPLLFLPRPTVPIRGHAFRPFNRPENLHSCVEGPSGFSSPKGSTGFHVPGRLAYRLGVQGTLPAGYSLVIQETQSLGWVINQRSPTSCLLSNQFFWGHGWTWSRAWLIPRRRDGTPS